MKRQEKTSRRSEKGKNEYFRELVAQAVKNQIQFHYVLNDSWFASAENMGFIKQEQNKELIMPLKDNRKIALSEKDKAQGRYVKGMIAMPPRISAWLMLVVNRFSLGWAATQDLTVCEPWGFISSDRTLVSRTIFIDQMLVRDAWVL